MASAIKASDIRVAFQIALAKDNQLSSTDLFDQLNAVTQEERQSISRFLHAASARGELVRYVEVGGGVTYTLSTKYDKTKVKTVPVKPVADPFCSVLSTMTEKLEAVLNTPHADAASDATDLVQDKIKTTHEGDAVEALLRTAFLNSRNALELFVGPVENNDVFYALVDACINSKITLKDYQVMRHI
jgi:hypothetical protein